MTDLPIELGRDEARRLARQELADPVYDTEPPLLQRIIEWVLDQLSSLIDGAAGALGGPGGLVVLGVIVAIVTAVLIRYRPLARRAAVRDEPVFGGPKRSAASYRAAAEDAARRADWATAVVERYRAIVAELEERAVLEPRPGRTADEAAREAGVVLPDVADQLFFGATTFDGVHYGDHRADEAAARALRELDDAVGSARIKPRADTATGLAVPQ
jgi:hypothetical protein